MKTTTDERLPKVVGISIDNPTRDPDALLVWLQRAVLKIWFKDGRRYLSGGVALFPSAGFSEPKKVPRVELALLGQWEVEGDDTVIYLHLDNGDVRWWRGSTGEFST